MPRDHRRKQVLSLDESSDEPIVVESEEHVHNNKSHVTVCLGMNEHCQCLRICPNEEDDLCVECDDFIDVMPDNELLVCEGKCGRAFHAPPTKAKANGKKWGQRTSPHILDRSRTIPLPPRPDCSSCPSDPPRSCNPLGLPHDIIAVMVGREDYRFQCPYCLTDRQPCFAKGCGAVGSTRKDAGAELRGVRRTMVQCSDCPRFYCRDCVDPPRRKGGRVQCPRHACRACEERGPGARGKGKRGDLGPLVSCRRCPVAYHAQCIPDGESGARDRTSIGTGHPPRDPPARFHLRSSPTSSLPDRDLRGQRSVLAGARRRLLLPRPPLAARAVRLLGEARASGREGRDLHRRGNALPVRRGGGRWDLAALLSDSTPDRTHPCLETPLPPALPRFHGHVARDPLFAGTSWARDVQQRARERAEAERRATTPLWERKRAAEGEAGGAAQKRARGVRGGQEGGSSVCGTVYVYVYCTVTLCFAP